MNLNPPKNANYCAVVVALSTFVDLPNCDNVKSALIFGNQVIVGKDTQPGAVGLFFPVETALSVEFLQFNNLYRKPEWGNINPEKKGFFDEHGRVKAVKFRGHKSEGFWIPISCLEYLDIYKDFVSFPWTGLEFDEIGGHEICHKYVPKHNQPKLANSKDKRSMRKLRPEERIVQDQFRYHVDTAQLRRNIHRITPDSWISISDKWHGTSVIIGNLLTNRTLKWWERYLQYFGVDIDDEEHALVWSSRRVIKGVGEEAPREGMQHFYGKDVWGEVANEIKDRIQKGITIYGEIVGYTSNGSFIQKGYHYGCQPGTHRLLVYRITTTNWDGNVIELPWQQMKEYCAKYGLEMVKELWFGKVKDFVPYWPEAEDLPKWQEAVLSAIQSRYVNDQMCKYNNQEVPSEGVVVRVDRLDEVESYKCKNFKFLEWETKQLDTGEVDMETNESEEVV